MRIRPIHLLCAAARIQLTAAVRSALELDSLEEEFRPTRLGGSCWLASSHHEGALGGLEEQRRPAILSSRGLACLAVRAVFSSVLSWSIALIRYELLKKSLDGLLKFG